MSSSRETGGSGAGQARAPAPQPGYPPVSVVMPVLDEARHVRTAVEHVLAQEYPGDLELVVAVGPSTDGTGAMVAGLAAEDPRVRAVPNPTGSTPCGLNAAIAEARHDVVVRVDGHAVLPPDYVRLAVDLLRRTDADNVGGVMAAEGVTPFERTVARAMTSPLGVGGARFHTGGDEGPADTVYLGVFRREVLAKLGGYDEAFARAQDWELNFRIRRAGGLVWFSPELRVSYRPRGSLRALAKQYRDYGRWRRVVMRQHPGSVTPRYLAPPAAVLGLSAGVVVGLAGLAGRSPTMAGGFGVPACYAAALGLGALLTGRGLPPSGLARLPVVYATMHLAWGWGFLSSQRSLGAGARSAERPGEPSVPVGS